MRKKRASLHIESLEDRLALSHAASPLTNLAATLIQPPPAHVEVLATVPQNPVGTALTNSVSSALTAVDPASTALTAIGNKEGQLGFQFTGPAVSGLEVVTNGYRVQFAYGDILYSPSTGAHEVHGALRDHYNALGGPSSSLGLPTTDVIATANWAANRFQGGDIYWSPTTGAHEVHGAIVGRYNAVGGPGSSLGLPTSDETATVNGGRFNSFQGGAIYWSPTTGAHEVHGAIVGRYNAVGGPSSSLGLPTSDETATVNGGRFNSFQGGAIYWSPTTGAHEVHGAIVGRYNAVGGPSSSLGLPTSDETATVNGGRFNSFQGGDIYWSPTTGAHEVHGAIVGRYNAVGGPSSYLGLPTSDETATVNGGRFNSFQGGDIYWSPTTGAHEVHGAIVGRYNAVGGPSSYLGLPTSDETATVNGGRFNSFQGGDIYWSPTTGAHEVHGAINDHYNALGGPYSFLGLPTSDEAAAPDGGRFNSFQGGAIYWSPTTGAHEVHGAINDYYNALGGPYSFLGLPTSDEAAAPDGGRFNYFQGGAIHWSPTTGASLI